MIKYIFRSTGQYLGFIMNNYLFTRDGAYLGWIDNRLAWGADGQYRGAILEVENRAYVVRNKFTASPLPKSPRAAPATPAIPAPVANTTPIVLPLGYEDAF